MAHPHTVLISVNLPGDAVCVDIFRRGDGTFGFDEFRRDAEDGRGWFSIGHHGTQVFQTQANAEAAALTTRLAHRPLARLRNLAIKLTILTGRRESNYLATWLTNSTPSSAPSPTPPAARWWNA